MEVKVLPENLTPTCLVRYLLKCLKPCLCPLKRFGRSFFSGLQLWIWEPVTYPIARGSQKRGLCCWRCRTPGDPSDMGLASCNGGWGWQSWLCLVWSQWCWNWQRWTPRGCCSAQWHSDHRTEEVFPHHPGWFFWVWSLGKISLAYCWGWWWCWSKSDASCGRWVVQELQLVSHSQLHLAGK